MSGLILLEQVSHDDGMVRKKRTAFIISGVASHNRQGEMQEHVLLRWHILIVTNNICEVLVVHRS